MKEREFLKKVFKSLGEWFFPSSDGRRVTFPADEVKPALNDWVKHEIKVGVERYYEMGKFLFACTVGGITVFLGAARLVNEFNMLYLGLSLASGLCSMGLALLITVPRTVMVGGSVDIHATYLATLGRARRMLLLWIVIAFFSVLFAFLALFAPVPTEAPSPLGTYL